MGTESGTTTASWSSLQVRRRDWRCGHPGWWCLFARIPLQDFCSRYLWVWVVGEETCGGSPGVAYCEKSETTCASPGKALCPAPLVESLELILGIPHLPAPSLLRRPPPQSQSLTSARPLSSPLFPSSPSCHPKHAQGFFLLLERTACSQRKEGGSEERRKISFCGGRGAREKASSVEMRVQKAIKRNKASRPATLPGCQAVREGKRQV